MNPRRSWGFEPIERRASAPGAPNRDLLGWALLIAAAAALPLLYLHTYRGGPVHAIGWDSYGYMWQSRIAGVDALAEVGTRLGVPVIGSLVEHLLRVDPTVEPVVLGMALTIGLATATAAVVGIAFRLPGWSLAVIALAVGWWGGTARLAAGYQANLLSLLLFTGAISVFLRSRGRTSLLVLGGLVMFACGMTHPGFLPVYIGITLGWVVLSLPQLRPGVRKGRPLLRAEPVAALAASLVTLVAVALIVFVLLHHSLRDVADLSVVSALFRDRLAKLPGQVGIITTVPLAAIGFAIGFRIRRHREASLVSSLAVAWLAACLAGLVLGLVDSKFPAHRAVLFATPVAALIGFGVAGVGASIAAVGPRRGWARAFVAAAAAVTMAGALAAVAWTGHRTYGDLAASPRGYIDDPALRTAAYIETVKPTVPVVVVTNRSELQGLVFAKLYFNATRAYAPASVVPHIYTYLGSPKQILAGKPAQIADPTEDWMLGYNEVSLDAWPDVHRAVQDGAIILFNEEQVSTAVWETAIPDAPTHQVAPGLFIVRGPLTTPTATVAPPAVSIATTTIEVLLTLVVLAIVGGGYAWASVALGGGSALGAAGLAPALGAAFAVVSGLAVAAAGIVPGSPVGVTILGVIAAGGYAFAIVARRREGVAGGGWLLVPDIEEVSATVPAEPTGPPSG
ncbi:MAG: hypothetical protein M3O98_08260 [Actinomycetota bacterium]|nr:hypothetical protein [Actinomycetota bacterium]